MHPLHRHINSQIDLSPTDFEELLQHFKSCRFKKGDLIVSSGSRVKYQYFVLSGCLRTYMIDASGKEHSLQFAIENWWVSDYIAYYKEEEAVMFVECIEDSEVLRIAKKVLLRLFDSNAHIERFFRKQLENAFVAFQKRILSHLYQTAEERYDQFIKTYPNIETRVKNYQIASYLGITQESLSRLRKNRSFNRS